MTQSARWNGSSFGTAFSYANDFLGNRVSRGSSTSQGSGYTLYTWDHVNRLKKTVSASNGATFTYRPDGLRADKIKSHVLSWNVTGEDSGYYDEDEDTNQPTTRYFYDGQMTVEEDYLESVIGDVMYYLTQYALGARGIDGIRKYDEINEESWLYPVYDGHGNQIATLSRSGSSFALDNERLYDAWGVVKTGASTGGPANRYVANIGHQQDDESGLIYMRARYYEPWTGRFVSEDPAMDGMNWYVYCGNDPVGRSDQSGKADESTQNWQYFFYWVAVGAYVGTVLRACQQSSLAKVVALSGLVMLYNWFCDSHDPSDSFGVKMTEFNLNAMLPVTFYGLWYALTLEQFGVVALRGGVAQEASGVISVYFATLSVFMALESLQQSIL